MRRFGKREAIFSFRRGQACDIILIGHGRCEAQPDATMYKITRREERATQPI